MNELIENIKVSFKSIKSQMLRTVITSLIIAIGITALVGILTAIDSIKGAISTEFALMGANTFNIRNRGTSVRVGKKGKRPKQYKEITFREAIAFKKDFYERGIVSVSTWATGAATVSFGAKESNPNVSVMGTDENYLFTAGYKLSEGRNFNELDVKGYKPVVIIGEELNSMLFPAQNPVNREISIDGRKYLVIGVLKEKGSSMGFGGDRNCFIPISNARQFFGRDNMTYAINVTTNGPEDMTTCINEAIGLFRTVRKVKVGGENNFEITRSDTLSTSLIENLQTVTIAAMIIGFITLLGAAISLMNIMLVSVNERTKEIGTRKAIGATRKSIMIQFLTEAVLICIIGGIAGVILGILAGNSTSFIFGTNFIIPWNWISIGLIMCFATGIISGLYPAVRASRLDPIEALRYE